MRNENENSNENHEMTNQSSFGMMRRHENLDRILGWHLRVHMELWDEVIPTKWEI